MKIEEIDIYEQLTNAGVVDIERFRMKMVSEKSRYFQYHVTGGNQDEVEIINVESTAEQVMEEFTHMPVDYQRRIFYQIVLQLKEPGAQLIVNGDSKKRGARIIRLASDDDYNHNLLLTH
jgi:hypothetical protein